MLKSGTKIDIILLGDMMKIAFYTLGCKVNQYETQYLREEFCDRGYTVIDPHEDFDIIVINSCTVTAESDRKVRQALRRFKRKNPDCITVLTGCMVQAFPEKSAELLADITVGNTDVAGIVALVEDFIEKREQIKKIEAHTKDEIFNTPLISRFDERTRAYVKIEDGCERYCTYCIIPFARGRVRSKVPELIKKEAEALAKNGYLEIVLVGINLSAYGKDEQLNLADAIDAVCSVEGIKRVRLGSLEPDHISDEMLMRFKCQEKFCPQFHLSLQSGCDSTLKRMNRHYNTVFYYDLIERIRKIFPDAAITTDIMVGFAGETKEDFEDSVAFLKKCKFAKAHVFAYSRREGTIAYGLPNQVNNKEKAERSEKMISAAASCESEFLSSQVGKIFPVLFETPQDSFQVGFTPNYSKVLVSTPETLTGEIRNVKIVKAEKNFCFGELI